MPIVNSRDELIQYALRALGHPVIEINIEDNQLDDCINSAFQTYQEYHYDSIERVYLKRQISASSVTVSGQVGTFLKDEYVLASVSSTSFQVYDSQPNTIRSIAITNGNLQVGETITGQLSGATAVVVSVFIGDLQNRWLPVPDSIHAITKLLSWNQVAQKISMFDIRYQIRLNDIYSITDTSLVYYYQMMSHLSMMEQILIAEPSIRFNKHTGRVYLDADFTKLAPDDYLVLECYEILDPNYYTKVYNDRILKKLCVSYIKKQWGTNMSKFDGVVLPGGIKLRGVAIYQEAMAEIERTENELRSMFEVPAIFITG